MNILFLSCQKASELIEKQNLFKLTILEKIQLKIHKAMCKACELYEKQSIIIEKGLSAYHHQHSPDIENLQKEINNRLNQ